MLLHQITDDCIGPALAELAIEVCVACRISMTGYFHDISFGVHKWDVGLLSQLNASIVRMRPQIDQVLAAYDVPRAKAGEGK